MKTSRKTGLNTGAGRFIAFTVLFALCYIAGMGVFYYHLMARVSEDAYATAISSATLQRAEEMKGFVDDMVSSLENRVSGLPALDDSTRAALLAEILEDYRDVVSGILMLDAQNEIVAGSSAGDRTRTSQITVLSNAVSRAESGLATFCAPQQGERGKTHFRLFVPVFDGPTYHGMLVMLIPADYVTDRFLATLKTVLTEKIFLRAADGQITASLMKFPEPAVLQTSEVLRKETLIMADTPKPVEYSVTLLDDSKYFEVLTGFSLSGTSWDIAVVVPYRAVHMAPHAFFKGSVIVSAWILPLLGIMILLSVRMLITLTQKREHSDCLIKLEHTQARLLELIHLIPHAVYITFDYESETSFFSDKITTITGYTPVELMADSKLWTHIIHPDHKEHVLKCRAALFKNKTGFSITYEVKHQSGQWVKIRETASPVFDSSGNISQIIGMIIRIPDSGEAVEDAEPGKVIMQDTTDLPDNNKQKSTGAGKGNILFVDDDRLLISLFSGKLQEAGYGITTAFNGLEAVQAYAERPESFDLVILDMVMPKMSGLEAIEHLKKINPDVRIMGISGYSKDGREWDLSKQGIGSFLSKPFDHEDLINAVRSALE